MQNLLEDEEVVLSLTLQVRRSGAMSIAGCVNDEANALAMLDAARDTITMRQARKKLSAGGIVVPSSTMGIM